MMNNFDILRVMQLCFIMSPKKRTGKILSIFNLWLLQDKGLRELAAEALSALVKYDPGYFANFVLEKLIPCTLSTDLCTRHGATLAAGEIVLALNRCEYTLTTGLYSELQSVNRKLIVLSCIRV